MTESYDVTSIRHRREALLRAAIGLEDALASPLGDQHRWCLRVSMATDHATMRIDEHISQTEGCGNILEEIRTRAPRLDQRVSQMLLDHEHLEKAAHSLRTAVSQLEFVEDRDWEKAAVDVRQKAVDMMGLIARHRQRGSDLVYEAYQVDLGDSA